MPALDPQKIRADFPVLQREVRPGVPLVYLDSAATSQKPDAVLSALDSYYRLHNANVHRGIHTLAEEATALYEGARRKVAAFINAASAREVIFTRNASEAINLVAHSWGRARLKVGDRLLLTEMEHHSNLVPWQMLSAERGLEIDIIPITADGLLDLAEADKLLALAPRLLAFTHMSNVLGTINPVAELCRRAHAAGAVVLVDGAQSVPHFAVDVQALGADFYVFSSHKMCGPTGIGVLWGREALLDAMPPFLGGGDMISSVQLREFTPAALPHKFEAGTPAIAEAAGLGAAVDYLQAVGIDSIHAYEAELTEYVLERLSEVPGLTLYGPPAAGRGGVAAFTLKGVHAHDVAQVLDGSGVAVRAGMHCTMPLHARLGVSATARASFYLYNTAAEIDVLVAGLERVNNMFA
ncbi:probable cysteine desulfurase [Anaerolineaceae bacterium]|nr:probable cysteine desulfurase [Anaerolineaceae bacterium]